MIKSIKTLILAGCLTVFGMGAQAATMYAHVQNNLPKYVSVTLYNDGAVFGGGTAFTPVDVTANTSRTVTGNFTDGVKAEIYLSPYSIGGGAVWSNYYCMRSSNVSYAAAASQPCNESNTYTTSQRPSTPSYKSPNVYIVLTVTTAPNCPATTLNWGTSNFCTSTVGATGIGGSLAMTNTRAGATGSATAYCSNGTWQVQSPSCSAALADPASLTATQGTIAGKVQLNWAAVSGAASYEVQYRKGAGAWTSVPNAPIGWQHSTTDEAVFEYQVRATNAVGAGAWSASATGFIRPQIMPVFISQTVPTDVRAGASFSASQVWKNTGYTSWSDATFQLVQAAASGNFGATPGTFSPAVTQDQNGTSTLALVAPATPGTYSLSRQFTKGGVNYGSPSTPVNIKVWGDPVCSALTVSKPYLYDQSGTVSVQFSVNNQTTAQTASVWNETAGQGSAKPYTPVYSAGAHKFDIPLANHSGQIGTYRVKIDVSNVVASASCEVTFELRPLDIPVANLQALIGTGSTANSFVVGQTAAQAILTASITRTENLPMVLDLVDGGGATAASAALGAGAASINLGGARWTGDAWSIQPYTLRVRYADPAAASQGKNLDVPVTLILTPSGNTLTLGIAPGHPLTATTAVARGVQPYDAAAQGNWTSKVGVQGGADLDSLLAMDTNGQRQHTLDYNTLYGKSLTGTARAVPPAGITLLSPLEITTTAKLPVLPVRNLVATDGTLEDVVRVSWDTPAAGASDFTYDVYRDSQLIQSGQTTNTLDDAPPVRGQEYSYRVVAMLSTDKSPESADPGHVPACRAARLIGASLNADMSAINGMLERWDCLAGMTASSAIDAQTPGEMPYAGSSVYRSFSVAVPSGLADGAHVLRVGMESEGVTINASRTYDVPFNLNRASISVNSLTILYDGAPAQNGVNAISLGRFGVRMEGGNGIGFAEQVK